MKNSSELLWMNPRQKKRSCIRKAPFLSWLVQVVERHVLTHRMAYILAEEAVQPWNILAITFYE